MSNYKFILNGVREPRTTANLFQSSTDVQKFIADKRDSAWYESIFDYNEEHKKYIEAKGTNTGIRDATTAKLVWDFDSKDNIEKAQEDAQILCTRLSDAGIEDEFIDVAFSGSKGFAIVVRCKQRFTVDEFRSINTNLAEGLSTNDSHILDPNRIFRITGSRHLESNLYKTPISLQQLFNCSIAEIKALAVHAPSNVPQRLSVDLPTSVRGLASKTVKIQPKPPMDVSELSFKTKPKGFSNCKYALLNGFFPNGTRDNCLMAIAATSMSTGFPKTHTLALVTAARDAQEAMFGTGKEIISDRRVEEIAESVHAPEWHGGMYSCKTTPWLREICESLGVNKCKHNSDESVISSKEVFSLFSTYAENYEKNILRTGIPQLDKQVNFLVGTSNGILAPPGVGKSSLALAMLNHNSKENLHSIFFSYDMYHSMVFIRLLQKHTGLQQSKIYEVFKHEKKKAAEWNELIHNEYKNVHFCFKSGQSADEIETTIMDTEDKTGNKIKLIVVDYNELVIANSSDPTQASAEVAQRLRRIANDREVCAVTLLQPAKISSNPADEATSYQAAKGSGAIAQSLTLMLGLNRPGFNPGYPEDDRYFTVSALKNRNGQLFRIDMGWDGLKGSFPELSYEDEQRLKEIRSARDAKKNAENAY